MVLTILFFANVLKALNIRNPPTDKAINPTGETLVNTASTESIEPITNAFLSNGLEEISFPSLYIPSDTTEDLALILFKKQLMLDANTQV